MKLFVKVKALDATAGTWVVCASCWNKIKLNSAWADVGGQAFVAYCCLKCMEELQQVLHERNEFPRKNE